MQFKDKFNLTSEENIFLLRKHISSLVYTGLKMENRNITFPQTQIILQGINDNGVALDDIYAVIGLKRAFQCLIAKLYRPLTLDVIKSFNLYIAKMEAIESGVIRNGNVSISGTDYTPPLLTEDEVNNEIKKILNTDKTDTEKGVDLFLNMIYKQYFWDGNKRTALLSANFYMCKKGCGILEIKEKDMHSFATLLNNMFNTGNNSTLKEFIYNNCISGIERVSVKENER